MADQEITKHTKNIWHLLTQSDHGFWHKVREIALEIAIIVFAVTLSIELHGVSEHRHEQKQVAHFLLGLKHDIQNDIEQVEGIVNEQRKFDANFSSLAALDPAASPSESFDTAYELMQSNAFLVPQVSRFEGFKSSGKLTNIEDEALLEKIVTFYQYDLPKVQMSFGGWDARHRKLMNYIDQNADGNDTRIQHYRLITSPKGKYLVGHMQAHPQLYERYARIVSNGKAIIADINRLYPEHSDESSASGAKTAH
jgi:hypothetical protein